MNNHGFAGSLKRVIIGALAVMMVVGLSGCEALGSWGSDVKGKLVGQAFTMTGYDNFGNETMTVHGDKIGMESNKVKDQDSTDGGTKTSAVITITVDGKEIESCGDTLVFVEDGLEPTKNYSGEMVEINSKSNTGDFMTNTLVAKPLNKFKNLFGKDRIVVVKSQLGTPIEVFQGNSVYWEVRDDLPKTTKLQIDGKSIYLHRANFQIIDSSLIE